MRSAIADPLVRVLLTDKWEGSIILLQIICFSMMWYPIHAINLNLLTVKGRSDLFFRLEIFKKVVGVIIMCITIPNGIIWMVSGSIASSMIALVINTYYTGKIIHVGYFKQMRDLLPIFGVSFAMWLVIHASFWFSSNIYTQLFIGVIVGVVFYLVSAKNILKSEWNDVLDMVPEKFKHK